MNILITGGNGFLARNLAEGLAAEHNVCNPSRAGLDLLDSHKVKTFLETGHFDLILHAANYDAAPKTSTKDPAKVLENNLRMFFNLVRCQGSFGKLIFFGSGAEFGRENWRPKMEESYFGSYIPADQYGFSKYIMTRYALTSGNVHNFRLFGVFGKYDDWRYRFIPNICAQAVVGDGLTVKRNNKFDYISSEDVVRVVRQFIAGKLPRRVYNICSGKAYEFKTLAEIVLKVSGKTIPIRVESDGLEYTGSNLLLQADLGGFDFIPIEKSIRLVYEWLSDNKSMINRESLFEDIK